jgi:gliding motility-associated-like protein
MKKDILWLVLFLFLFQAHSGAQAPLFSWQKCLGSPYEDWGQTVAPTSDGGSIAIGWVNGAGGDVAVEYGSSDYWVSKLDNTGAVQWSISLGGTYQDYGSVVRQTADGGYIVGGEAASLPGTGNVTAGNNGGLDWWLVKLSSSGAILWQKNYGGAQNEYLGDLRVTADGGFILAGSTQAGAGQIAGNHGNYDFWVAKLNSDGSMAWQKVIGGSQDDWCYSVRAVAGGYVVSGYTESTDGDAVGNHGSDDVLAAKLDLSGNLVWTKCLGGSGYDQGYGVAAAADGSGYLFAGLTRSDDGMVVGNHGSAGWQDAWVIKLDVNGNELWQHCYGGSYNEGAYSIAPTADGGFVLAGAAQSLDGDVTCMPASVPQVGEYAGWVFKISATGALLWEKVISGGYYDTENDAEEAADGSIMICGYTCLSDFPGYHHDVENVVGDLYVGKLSPPLSLSITVPPVNICSGAQVVLTAVLNGINSGITYHWIKNGVDQGINAATYSSTGFANGDVVQCQVAVTDGDCGAPTTLTSNAVTMSVSALVAPAISIASGAAGAVCAGTPLGFSAAVTGGDGSGSYEWLVNGAAAGAGGGSGTGAGASFSPTGLNNGDLISCVYVDNTVCVVPGQIVSNVITAQIVPVVDVSVVVSASAQTVCAGSGVDFSAVIGGGGGAPVLEWDLNGVPVGLGTSFSSSTLNNGDVVSCQLKSSAACASPDPAVSNAIAITVHPVLVSAVSVGYAPAVLCSGKPVVFTAAAVNGGTDPTYDWSVNGAAVGGTGTGASFSSSSLASGDVVSCQVSNAAQCVVASQGAVTVTVYPTPEVGVVAPVIINKGQSLTLALPVTGDVASYAWSPSLGLSDSTAAAPVAEPLKTTDYLLTVVSPEGCSDTGDVLVKVYSHLSIPGAFTPNGDGHNDIFYVIGGPIGSEIGDFAVFDRWGRAVFQVHGVAPDDPANGWNGVVDGIAASAGTYVYMVRMVFADGSQQVVKGTVILVR